MDENLLTYKKSFSSIGWSYFVFSIIALFLQVFAIVFANVVHPGSEDMQTILAAVSLYLFGTVILWFTFSVKKNPVQVPAKSRVSFTELVKIFFMCYALLIISNVIGSLITTAIGILKGTPLVNPLETAIYDVNPWVNFLTAVVMAPIFEEIVFRRFLVDRVLPFGEIPAILLSGFMFGLFHGNLFQFPYAFALGAFLAYIYIRSGRMWICMLMHALVNFMGSIVTIWILKVSNFDELTDLIAETGSNYLENIDGTLHLFSQPEFLALVLYEAVILIIVVIGCILWILNFTKIKKSIQTPSLLPKGKGPGIALCNWGMMLYMVYWGLNILLMTLL